MPRKNPKVDHYVNVHVLETRAIERQLGPFGSRRMAARAEVGIQRQLDTKTHFTAISDKRVAT